MKELKCPKCGNVFTVDESDYADIVDSPRHAESYNIQTSPMSCMNERDRIPAFQGNRQNTTG